MSEELDELYPQLAHRIGRDVLADRLYTQVEHASQVYVGAKGGLHLENAESFAAVVQSLLLLGGLLGRARRNALAIRLVTHPAPLQGLPEAFNGFRILQLSDVHLDGFKDGGIALRRRLAGVEFDLCVITGDFRFLTMGPHAEVMSKLNSIMPLLGCEYGVYGILGNHDFIEFVPELEQAGVAMLLNESVALERDGQRIHMAGVDDPHFYLTHDLDRALKDVPEEEMVILLAHSPELYREAEERRIRFYLCGHTHGGQLCLPGGIPIMTNCRAPRRLVAGSWRSGAMLGYTSRGVGSSGVFARLNCPPEITLHILGG